MNKQLAQAVLTYIQNSPLRHNVVQHWHFYFQYLIEACSNCRKCEYGRMKRCEKCAKNVYCNESCRKPHLPFHDSECKVAVDQLTRLVLSRSKKYAEIYSSSAQDSMPDQQAILEEFYKYIVTLKPFLGFLATTLVQHVHHALCIDALASADMVVMTIAPTVARIISDGDPLPWQQTFRVIELYRTDLDEKRLEKLYHEMCARRKRTQRREDCILVRVQLVQEDAKSNSLGSQPDRPLHAIKAIQTLLVPIERTAWSYRSQEVRELYRNYLRYGLAYPAQEDLYDLCTLRYVDAFGCVWVAQAIARKIQAELSLQYEAEVTESDNVPSKVAGRILDCIEAPEQHSIWTEQRKQLVCPDLDTLIAAIVTDWLAEQYQACRTFDAQDYRTCVKPIMTRLAQKVGAAKIQRIKENAISARRIANVQQRADRVAQVITETSNRDRERMAAERRMRNKTKINLLSWLAEDDSTNESFVRDSPAASSKAVLTMPINDAVAENEADIDATSPGRYGCLSTQKDVSFTLKPRILACNKAVAGGHPPPTARSDPPVSKLSIRSMPRARTPLAYCNLIATQSTVSGDLSLKASLSSSASSRVEIDHRSSRISRSTSMTSLTGLSERSSDDLQIPQKPNTPIRNDPGYTCFRHEARRAVAAADNKLTCHTRHGNTLVPHSTAVRNWLATQTVPGDRQIAPVFGNFECVLPSILKSQRSSKSVPLSILVDNVACDWSIPDPHLTGLGQQQARSIPIAYPKMFDASDVILTSPLRRTIQSTLLGFPKLAEGKKPVEILPDLQETQDKPCDTGSPRTALEAEFTQPFLDFSHCVDGWNIKQGRNAATAEALDNRAFDVRRMLRARSEELVTVVCHAGFLKHLVLLPHAHRWHNAEARVYRFDSSSEQAEARAILERIPIEEEQKLLGGSQAILVESW